jgi:hypothetical protein
MRAPIFSILAKTVGDLLTSTFLNALSYILKSHQLGSYALVKPAINVGLGAKTSSLRDLKRSIIHNIMDLI